MNADEGRVCVRLLGGVPEGLNGYILGDGSYNDNKLFAAARVRGLQLVSPRRRPGTGLGQIGRVRDDRRDDRPPPATKTGGFDGRLMQRAYGEGF